MANELNIVLADKGLAVTCQRYLNGAAVSPAITLAGSILWDGTQEVTLFPIKTKTDALDTTRLANCSTVEITGQQIATI